MSWLELCPVFYLQLIANLEGFRCSKFFFEAIHMPS
ncbi:MAG: hypothetical protein ACI86H_001721, partial [bacterium]